MTFPSVDEQLSIIRRGVESIVPEEELAKKLTESAKTGRPLRIKYGIDPTAADVHLGHTVPLRKMRQFQELGHQAVIIIGNYTAMVGDPSGRDEARSKKLTEEQVEENARYYLSQVGKVIDLDSAEVHRNGDWFCKMDFAAMLALCGRVTIAQLLTRDDFSKRMKAETPIFLHECLYPIMQAFDSVVIDADVELGGTEQLYSFMLARDLQKDSGVCELAQKFRPASVPEVDIKKGIQRQQLSVMSPILVGTDGKRRMGKSLGNYIGISEDAYEMMKKFMQIPDDVLRTYFELLTNIDIVEVDSILSGHLKEAKKSLAVQVISQYYDLPIAEQSAIRWENEIPKGNLPEDIPEVTLDLPADVERDDTGAPVLGVLDLFFLAKLRNSKGEVRRLVQEGGAYIGDDLRRVEDVSERITVEDNLLLKAGKKKIARVRLS